LLVIKIKTTTTETLQPKDSEQMALQHNIETAGCRNRKIKSTKEKKLKMDDYESKKNKETFQKR
jgi:hypothetical protein